MNALGLSPKASTSEQGKAAAYPIASVDNALMLLHLVGRRQAVRLTEVSRALDVAPSTAHRLLAMLTMHGFVLRDPDTRSYVAGPAFSGVGLEDESTSGFLGRGHEVLRRLTAEIGETSNLCVLRGASVLFVASVEIDRLPRIGSRKGVLMPAHCTSAGKALLAQLPLEVVATLYGDQPLVGLAPSSITEFDRLEAELARVRDQGWASNVGESESDVRGVAVAARAAGDGPWAALCVAGHASRMTTERVRDVVPILHRAAELLMA